MDIAGLSVVLNQAQVKQQANILVLKQAMDASKSHAQGMVNMLQDAVPHPYLGGKIDIKA